MKVAAVCVGRAERLAGKASKTGINKSPVLEGVLIHKDGVSGDAVCNGKYHGGLDQAVLLEGERTLDWWSQKLGVPIAPGLFGENLVIRGLDNRDISAGDTFHVGNDLVLQATSPRTPCGTLATRMGDRTFTRLYRDAARPGIYCRVLRPGLAVAGDQVEHSRYGGATISIPEMLEKFGTRLSEEDAVRYLSVPIHERMSASIREGGKARF